MAKSDYINFFFFFNDTATTEIYTLSLHDALPISMVAASVGIGFVSLSVWAHHMFTVGMGAGANTFFVISTMAISVPSGIKIFNWLATIWGGRVHFTAAMMFAIGFLFQFLVAG